MTLRRGVALLIVAVLGACGPSSTSSSAGGAAGVPATAGATSAGGVAVTHQPSRAYPDVGKWFADSAVLYGAADLLNRVFVLEKRIDLVAADCGRANAYYDPHNRTVTLCHELVAVIAGAFTDKTYLRHLYLYVALHELGHALIDVLDLPVVGREEDAADQFAALFFINVAERDLGLVMGVVLAAQFFRRADTDQAVFWDNHSFGEARYYQLMCLIYGGAPQARDIIGKVLPADRGEQCVGEYRQVRRGWNRLLAPHRRGGGDTFAE